jgi:hypothetical protein
VRGDLRVDGVQLEVQGHEPRDERRPVIIGRLACALVVASALRVDAPAVQRRKLLGDRLLLRRDLCQRALAS